MSEVEYLKVVVIGEIGVGKTSIINQFIYQTFQKNLESTTGVAFRTKTVIYDNSKILKFEIWDTAGQERYRSITKMFYKNANAAILVYDITNKDSFKEIKNYWANQIKESSPPDIILVIAANKYDLIDEEVVDEKEASKFAEEFGATFMNTSAKEIESINDLFIQITKKYTGSNEITIKEEEDNPDQQMEERIDYLRLDRENYSDRYGNEHRCC